MSETPNQKVIRRARALVQKADDRQKWDRFVSVADLNLDLHALRDACDEAEGVKETKRTPYRAKTLKNSGGSDGEMQEEHESFGLVSLSRRSHGGGTSLFGSSISQHPTTIVLSIQRGCRIHSNLAYDRFFHAEGNDHHIVDIELSSAQFADLITNPNMGVGSPCTIREVNGIRMEDVPSEHKSEQTHIIENFSREMEGVKSKFKPDLEAAQAILAKKTIGKGDREKLSGLLSKIVRVLGDHAPHVAEMFGEATDKMVTQAKKEVEAYASTVIHTAGLEHLRSGQFQEALDDSVHITKALGEKGDDGSC